MPQTFKWGGRTWGPGDRKKFAAWLSKRGARFDEFAQNHPDLVGRVYPGVLDQAARNPNGNPRLLDAALTSRVNSLLAPERNAIDAERLAAQQSSKRLIANNRGFAEALAGMLKGQGDAVRSGYTQAAGEIGALGRGFADQQVAQGSAEAQSAAALLDKAGMGQQAPQVAQAAGGAAAGDVMYGLGGYIPATTLAREGAAFGAAADNLPYQAAGIGLETGRQLAADAREQDLAFGRQLAELQQKAPGLRAEVLQALLENQRADQAMAIQRQYLGLAGDKFSHDVTQDAIDTQLKVATVQGKAASKAQANQAKAVKAREDDFAEAQTRIFRDADSLGETVETFVDPAKPWLGKTKTTKLPSYAAAKKALFDKYKYLLRYSARAGRPALRRRINQMIDEALAAKGIHPPKPKPAPRVDKRYGAGSPASGRKG